MYLEKASLPTPNSGLTLRKCQKYSNVKEERVIEGIPAVTQRAGIPQVCVTPRCKCSTGQTYTVTTHICSASRGPLRVGGGVEGGGTLFLVETLTFTQQYLSC